MARRKEKDDARALAAERMDALAGLAEDAARAGEVPRATRYVVLARRIGMRTQLAMPTRLRRRTCRGCGTYQQPGATSRTRLRGGKAVTTCLVCERVERVPLAGERAPREARPRSGAPRRQA